MKDRVKFAIAGFGNIGRRHAEMISKDKNAELVAISDVNKKFSDEVKDNLGIAFFDSYEAMLKSDLPFDVVNICTPNGLHASQANDALDRDCNVVCEKPMGLTKNECEHVIFKALQLSKQVFCVMQNRHSPPSIWLKKLITDQIIGKIYMVQINCYWNRSDSYYKQSKWKGTLKLDGGPLFTQFSHFIDIMYWLFGDIKNIHAQFNYFRHKKITEFEDSGIVNFEFIRGGMGSVNYSTAVYGKNLESSMMIIGENGSVKIGGQYMDIIEYCNIKDYKLPKLDKVNPPNKYGNYEGSASNHQFVIQNVVETLTGNSIITTNALEGLKVVEIIERIYSQR
ncbi:Gfo/Idh/MocA family oxidoreductase [Candidatus Amoebophilus asiaticus]|nr:Gfo/Idh/MocA family oxidoreductase [Candidatus Amoebophilus asiaticus]